MLTELHVVTLDIVDTKLFSIKEVTPALFSFGPLIKAERSRLSLNHNQQMQIAPECLNNSVGNFLTVFEMSNGSTIYIAEDYDWIRKHCSD